LPLPSLNEILDQLQFITRELALLGLFVTGGLIVLVRDWRASLLALLAQYLLTGLILSRLVSPEIALIKVLIGALICPMLYLAARQAGWQIDRRSRLRMPGLQATADPASAVPAGSAQRVRGDVFPAGRAFRLLAVTLMGLLALALSRAYPMPAIPPSVGLGSYWLILIGLLILMLTEEPLKAGQGLLTAIIGFELLYTTIERSLAMVWLAAVVNLLLALAIAYLAVVRDAGLGEDDL
jgi:hypothetical protein